MGRPAPIAHWSAPILVLNCSRLFPADTLHAALDGVTHLWSSFDFNVVVKFQHHVWCWISSSMLRFQKWGPKISPPNFFPNFFFQTYKYLIFFNSPWKCSIICIPCFQHHVWCPIVRKSDAQASAPTPPSNLLVSYCRDANHQSVTYDARHVACDASDRWWDWYTNNINLHYCWLLQING